MSNLGEAVCPFYKKEVGTTLRCELATFRFPDAESKEQMKDYCCDMTKHQECPLHQILTAYYDRKYQGEEES